MNDAANINESSRTRRIVAAILCLLFIVPGLATCFGVKTKSIENRRKASWPEFAVLEVLDGKSLPGVSLYLSDHLALRDKLVHARARIFVELFGDSPNARVHLGRNGWLFYDVSFTRACEGIDSPSRIVQRLRRVAHILDDSGRKVIVTIVPDKHAVYPEMLGDALPWASCAMEQRSLLRAAIAAAPPHGYIDLWDQLETLKKEQPDPLLYIPTDSHWSSRSAAELSQSLVHAIDPGIWNPSALHRKAEKSHFGDLNKMMGRWARTPTSQYRVEREGVNSEAYSETRKGSPSARRYRVKSPVNTRMIEGRTLVIHDSFMYSAIPLLTPYFRDITFIHWQSAEHAPGLAAEFAAAKTVVIEIAERGTYNWPHRVLKDRALLRTLDAQLR